MSTISGKYKNNNSEIVNILSKMNETLSSLDLDNIGGTTTITKEGWLAPEQIEIYKNYSQTCDDVDDAIKINEVTKWSKLSNIKETGYFTSHEAHQFYIRIPKPFKIYNFVPLNKQDYDVPILLESSFVDNSDYNIYVCYVYGNNIGEINTKYPNKLDYPFTNWFKIYITENDDNYYTTSSSGAGAFVVTSYFSSESEWNSNTWYHYVASRINKDDISGDLYEWLANNIQNLNYVYEKGYSFNSSDEYEYIAICINNKNFRNNYLSSISSNLINSTPYPLDCKFICTDEKHAYYFLKLSSEVYTDDNLRVYNLGNLGLNGYKNGYIQRNVYIPKKTMKISDTKVIQYQDIQNEIKMPAETFTIEQINTILENTEIDFDSLPIVKFPFKTGYYRKDDTNKYAILKLPKKIKLRRSDDTSNSPISIASVSNGNMYIDYKPIYESDKFCYYKVYYSISSNSAVQLTINSIEYYEQLI